MLGAKKILIVDDSAQDIALLEDALRQCGIEQIQSFTSGMAASQYIAGCPPYQLRAMPDLIFVDLKMGGMNGFDMIHCLHRNPSFKHVSLIVLSGSNSPDQKDHALALGATAFYQKPQDHRDLVSLVEKIMHEFLVPA